MRRRRKGRSWRIRIVPKIVVPAIWSPSVKLLARLRDAYLNAMINVAGKNWGNVFGGKRITRAREASPVIYSYNEVENRIVLELFKALKAHQP
ncbi:hypothetical protein MLD38_034671 [Melastoma candidum]|uniref:Uncharacterized protein n=1 Tax=Melastoma candidum TaxID=119954 RepID=A0ACB9MCQ7_9MYRT|nr:hypothetical protein MLD38_034671 [Melastoma candidum]